MPFTPKVGDTINIAGVAYSIAEHPAAPGTPYWQQGRQATVYQIVSGTDKRALKVFKQRFRVPGLVTVAHRLQRLLDLPGLQVCHRTVLTPQRHAELLREHPDLIYAVVMPWIDGPTWMEVLLEKRTLTSERSLSLARSFTETLSAMEQRSVAHCDLSGPNVLLLSFAEQLAPGPPTRIELIDVEQLHAPGMDGPPIVTPGSPGYAHHSASAGLWEPAADRFAGAVLLAEMLGWCDERVREAAWGESYFDPAEIHKRSERYHLMKHVLADRWSGEVARLLERAWQSDTLADCPTFGEWLLTLPENVALPTRLDVSTVQVAPPGPQEQSVTESVASDIDGAVESRISPLMEEARQLKIVQKLEAQSASIVEETGRPDNTSIEVVAPYMPISPEAEPIRPPVRRGWVWSLVPVILLVMLVFFVGITWLQAQSAARLAAELEQAQATATATLVVAQRTSTAHSQESATAVTISTQTSVAPQAATAQAAGTMTAQAIQAQQGTATAPALSPAHGRIAFMSYIDGNPEIYTINADGSEQTRLTNDPAIENMPAWSPDGKRIAFTSSRDATTDGNVGIYIEIYVMNADGSQPTRLTSNLAQDESPAWSPDGKQIAFVSKRDATTDEFYSEEIYVMNADGSQQTRLTNNTARDEMPAWSPDGRQIAFVSNRDDNASRIYVMNADGSQQTPLTDRSGLMPAWSPDGKQIAFYTNDEIYVMNADGSQQTRITSNSGLAQMPTWSPDGKHIACVLIRDGNADIYVMNADGSQQTRITSHAETDYYPAWSPDGQRPDGQRIAFVSSRDYYNAIHVVNADGSQQIPLTDNNGIEGRPVWSPDAQRIAFIRLSGERYDKSEIYVMNADGSQEIPLANDPKSETSPVWSPDGQRIAFESERDGNREIYVVNADGSQQTRLTDNPKLDSSPVWSPDGQRIVFVSERDGNQEIYVMNADGSQQTRFTNNPGSDSAPAWSSVGQRIAFESERDGNREIYVMNADGSQQTRLTNNSADDWTPVWSPDGQRIAFVSVRDSTGIMNHEIYVMNADGSQQTRLTNNPGPDNWIPAWSPDGQYIAFTGQRGEYLKIYVMNADGSQQTRLTDNPGHESSPAWSPK
jgi:Tol biopolymer transport system component